MLTTVIANKQFCELFIVFTMSGALVNNETSTLCHYNVLNPKPSDRDGFLIGWFEVIARVVDMKRFLKCHYVE